MIDMRLCLSACYETDAGTLIFIFQRNRAMRIDTDLKLLINRRTKIVATLGPSSGNPNLLAK